MNGIEQKIEALANRQERLKQPRRSSWRYPFYFAMLSTGLLLFTMAVKANSIDQHIEDARQLVKVGDLAQAAISYQKALKIDQNHAIARKELKDVLIESKIQDPESEYSEAEWALIESSKGKPKD